MFSDNENLKNNIEKKKTERDKANDYSEFFDSLFRETFGIDSLFDEMGITDDEYDHSEEPNFKKWYSHNHTINNIW